jgi:hypothetical protein
VLDLTQGWLGGELHDLSCIDHDRGTGLFLFPGATHNSERQDDKQETP